MKLFGLDFSLGRKEMSIDTLIRRIEAAHETLSGITVTPESAMQSPTVNSLVTGVSKRFAALPVHVMRKVESGGRVKREREPSHPVARLLERPNGWQSKTDFWLDATSRIMRYGNFYAFKSRGVTGPIRELLPLDPASVDTKQGEDWSVIHRATMPGGAPAEIQPAQMFHARGPARDGVKGDSPVMDVREAIALEIAAERFGASFFGNGAMPGIVFKFMQGFVGFKTDEERKRFIEEFQAAYARKGRFRSLLLPNGMEVDKSIPVENDKAQFLETRRLQRSIIAGAWGVPPHLVGDLERATFSNIEEQSLDFIQSVILPYARIFEAAMERDLLTTEDRRAGIIIRFNIDGALRGRFEERQKGLAIQRQNGIISANEWREHEGMNPREDPDGDAYFMQGPSGQTGTPTADPDGGEE